MALKTLRKHQKKLLAVLAVLAMFAFSFDVVFQAITPGRGRQRMQPVARVYGEEIYPTQLEKIAQERAIANRFLAMAWSVTGQQMQLQIWGTEFFGPVDQNSLLEAIALQKEADRLNIQFSDDMVTEFIYQVTGGQLTQQQFLGIVKQLGVSQYTVYAALKSQLRLRLVESLYFGRARQLADYSRVTPYDAWQLYRRVTEQVRFDAIPVPVSEFTALVEAPSEEELREFYQRYKDRIPSPEDPEPGFRRPPRVHIQFAAIRVDDLIDEMMAKITDEQIRQYYEENKELYRIDTTEATESPSGTEGGSAAGAQQSQEQTGSEEAQPSPQGEGQTDGAKASEPEDGRVQPGASEAQPRKEEPEAESEDQPESEDRPAAESKPDARSGQDEKKVESSGKGEAENASETTREGEPGDEGKKPEASPGNEQKGGAEGGASAETKDSGAAPDATPESPAAADSEGAPEKTDQTSLKTPSEPDTREETLPRDVARFVAVSFSQQPSEENDEQQAQEAARQEGTKETDPGQLNTGAVEGDQVHSRTGSEASSREQEQKEGTGDESRREGEQAAAQSDQPGPEKSQAADAGQPQAATSGERPAAAETSPEKEGAKDAAAAESGTQAGEQEGSEASGQKEQPSEETSEQGQESEEEKPKYRPLEEVADSIRRILAEREAEREAQARLEKLARVIREYVVQKYLPARQKYDEQVAQGKTKRDFVPPPFPDLRPLCEELGLELQDPGVISILNVEKLGPLAEAREIVGGAPQGPPFTAVFVPRPGDEQFAGAEVLEVRFFRDLEGTYYAVWARQRLPEETPPFEDIRDEVEQAYRLVKARPLAEKRARELAEELRRAGGDVQKLIAENEGLQVISAGPMTLWRRGLVLFGSGAIEPVEIPGIRHAGDELRQTLLDLPLNEPGVAPDRPQRTYYVLIVRERQPAKVEDFATQLPLYLQLGQQQQNREWMRRRRDDLWKSGVIELLKPATDHEQEATYAGL